jgi:hypothetical protein
MDMQEPFRAVCETIHLRRLGCRCWRRNCNDRPGPEGWMRTRYSTLLTNLHRTNWAHSKSAPEHITEDDSRQAPRV